MVGGSKCKEKSGIMHMRRKGRKGMRRSVGFMVVVKRYECYKYLGSVELTHTTTTTTDHHTVQVVQVQEQFLCKWVDVKHHQHKLQRVILPCV